MERWAGKVALVTGASIGIGAAIAKALVRHGMVVIGCARNVDQIKAIQSDLENESAKGSLHPIKCDLRNKEEIAAMFTEIRDKHKVIHVCINNAGLAFDASLSTGSADDWQNMLDVNIMALCRCTQESLSLMRENKFDEGHIIHISSLSGHRTLGIHFYSGTKFMVRALTEGLRQELRAQGSGIRVSCISPAVVETEFVPRLRRVDPADTTYYQDTPSLKPDDIAEEVLHILRRPQHVEIHDILMRPTPQKV